MEKLNLCLQNRFEELDITLHYSNGDFTGFYKRFNTCPVSPWEAGLLLLSHEGSISAISNRRKKPHNAFEGD